jgi:hypothetical protein
MPSVAFGA